MEAHISDGVMITVLIQGKRISLKFRNPEPSRVEIAWKVQRLVDER